jgi:hypothetical protein
LDRFSGDGFDEVMEINSLSYQLNPARFAIEAYRHYQKPGNGASFIEKVLAGTVWLRDQPAY